MINDRDLAAGIHEESRRFDETQRAERERAAFDDWYNTGRGAALPTIPDGKSFIVELRPEPAGPDQFGCDAVYRLRIALKRLLRSYGLRAVRVEGLPE